MRSFLSAQRPGLKSSLDWKWITTASPRCRACCRTLAVPTVPNRTSYPKCPLGWPKASVELMGPPQARLPLPKIKVFAENLERNPVTSPLPGFLCRRNPYYLREF